MNQDVATARRKTLGIGKEGISLSDFYHWSLALSPHLLGLLGDGKLVNGVKSASDYSYSSSSYATPYTRTVGDAGCFIDPFFSSGVHLALTSGLSAAATICAAIRGDCTEDVAARWHSHKITEAYSRFLVVVLSAYRQMRRQDQNILSQLREDNFDRAFAHLRPSMIVKLILYNNNFWLTEVQSFKALQTWAAASHRMSSPRLLTSAQQLLIRRSQKKGNLLFRSLRLWEKTLRTVISRTMSIFTRKTFLKKSSA